MPSIKCLDPGFNVTIQDLGRPKYQHLGVPVSGALAPIALRLANGLVDNSTHTAGLEIRMSGPTLEICAETTRVALTGTKVPLQLLDSNPVFLPANQSLLLRRGQRFKVGSLTDTATAYLAIEGGLDLPCVYESLSTYTRGEIGGFQGRALKAGDDLPLKRNEVQIRQELSLADLLYLKMIGPIRVVLGPQQDFFKPSSINTFLTNTYEITKDADRMGIRLNGPMLQHKKGYNIVSDGIVTGSIQIPGNGLPIILLADHQTTGGYPKLATVISADISRLGLMKPGTNISFRTVSVSEAEKARFDQEKKLQEQIKGMNPGNAWLDPKALYNSNLISGVV